MDIKQRFLESQPVSPGILLPCPLMITSEPYLASVEPRI